MSHRYFCAALVVWLAAACSLVAAEKAPVAKKPAKPAVATAAAAAEEASFPSLLSKIELTDGDTVVFLGDSITHQCLYTQYVEDYFYTRFPKMRLRFHNSGVGGDRAADALARFDDDVAAYKPKYVTILLGMNDGSYTRFEPEVFARYEQDMTTLLDRLASLGTTAIPMTPTMFDSRAVALGTKPGSELREKYYNSVLAFYGSWLREQAQNRGLGFIDMYGPLNRITLDQRKTDPKFTLIKDAVHPDAPGQFIMAYSILDELHHQGQVSSITANRRGSKWVVTAAGGKATDVADGEALKFTFQANALPWVVPEEARLGYDLVNAGHKMSNERIRVNGLPAGNYELRIDGTPVGTYNNLQLGFKVELQTNDKTPQYQQALQVALLNKERNDKGMHPLRDQWRNLKMLRRAADAFAADDDGPKAQQAQQKLADFQAQLPSEVAKLNQLIAQYDDKIYQANQPPPRTYELVPVK